MRSPGIEPGSTAWKATMLTITPATLYTMEDLKKNSQSETRTHNLPVNSRARCRLRHPGLLRVNNGDVAQMVERLLSMQEAQGSIPCFSTFFFLLGPPKKKCLDRGSNTGPLDLQSNALPTELSKQDEQGAIQTKK